MIDNRHDNDYKEYDLIDTETQEVEIIESEEVIDKEDVNLVDPTLDELEAMDSVELNRDDFVHRTKEESLKQYLADAMDRRNTKGHN